MYIYSSETMLEFQPFNPFPSQQPSTIEFSQIEDQNSDQSQNASNSSQLSFSISQSSNRSKKSSRADQPHSEQHNMVKQMIITIKNMMWNHIENIGSNSYIRTIIRKAWQIFVSIKNPNKEILKALFNEKLDLKTLKKLNLLDLVNEFGQKSYQQAMNDLRQEICIRMKGESIKSHLLDRKIAKKDRLTAYILYFIEEQLKKRQICYRFGLKAAQKIQDILTKIQQEQHFIDEFLQNSSEVSLRLTSKINGL